MAGGHGSPEVYLFIDLLKNPSIVLLGIFLFCLSTGV